MQPEDSRRGPVMPTCPQQPGVPACHSALTLLTDEIWRIIWQRGPVSSLNPGLPTDRVGRKDTRLAHPSSALSLGTRLRALGV